MPTRKEKLRKKRHEQYLKESTVPFYVSQTVKHILTTTNGIDSEVVDSTKQVLLKNDAPSKTMLPKKYVAPIKTRFSARLAAKAVKMIPDVNIVNVIQTSITTVDTMLSPTSRVGFEKNNIMEVVASSEKRSSLRLASKLARKPPLPSKVRRILPRVSHVHQTVSVIPSVGGLVKKRAATKHGVPSKSAIKSKSGRSYSRGNIRMAELKRKFFLNRVVSNVMRNATKVKGRYRQYLQKLQITSLVQDAMRIKNKLFGKVVSKVKTLDSILFKLGGNCRISRNLTPLNFCSIIGGKWQHTSYTERYFHDEMYHPVSAIPLAVDASGKCFQYVHGVLIDDEQIHDLKTTAATQSTVSKRVTTHKIRWNCTAKCNVRKESCSIFRKFLMSYIKKTNYSTKMKSLHEMDKCPIRTMTGRLGHSLSCLAHGVCPSILHHIRMIASHHTVMRTVVSYIYRARNPIRILQQLNECLVSGSPALLEMLIFKIRSIYFTTEQEAAVPTVGEGLESNVLSEHYLLTTYGPQMATYDAESTSLPNQVCVDCNRMCYPTQVRYVSVLDKVEDSTHAWTQLALYLIIEDVHDVQHDVIVCTYCLKFLNMNQVPARSVLNGMNLEVIPKCLQSLNPFELIALQTVHAFQVILRLKTKSGRFTAKELWKGLKGKVIYLPLDFKENILSLGLQEQPFEHLFVLVNGVPTKDQKIWQQILDIDKLRNALHYLKEHNAFYSDVEIESFLEQNTVVGINSETAGQFKYIPTQEREDLLDHFTVYPINPQEEAGDTLQLFQMQKAKSAPISLYEKTLETRCFPHLFPTGKGGRMDDRNQRISSAEYRTSRMYCIDRRFAINAEYIFHLFFESEFSAVCQAVQHTLKTGTRFVKVTAQELVQNVQQQNEFLENSVTNIFGTIRATKQYWSRRYSEVCCMLRYLGPPTWFVTLSCAEFSWQELLTFIRDTHKEVPGIGNMSAAQLCALDPVLVCRFFDQRFKAMLHFICNKIAPPLGVVVHYFYRKEFQARGAPHVHMMLWIKDAPIFGKDSDEHVLNFIHKHVTCDIPSEGQNPSLHEKVVKFQIHQCGAYCQRKFYSRGKFYIKCRFAFPRPVSATGKVNSFLSSVRHSVTKKSPKNAYYLKRGLDSQYINDYNPVILNMWNANMDVQFVADNAAAVARYVTGYITKPEKSHAQEIWQDLAADKTMPQRLMSYGVQMLQSRECGLPESINLITGSPLYGRSINVLWLSIGPFHVRKRVLKPFADIQKLADNFPTSTDILKDNLVSTYYPKRSLLLEEMCLFYVATYFTFRNLIPDESKGRYGLIEGSGCLVKHKKPSLINHRQLSTDTEEQRELYFFCLLQLFKPWRDERQLLGGQMSYEAAFLLVEDQIQSEELEMFRTTLQKEQEHQQQIVQELEQETPETVLGQSDDVADPLGQPIVQSEVHFAMGEVEGVMQQAATVVHNIADIHKDLNAGQKKIYDELVEEMHLSTAHNLGHCSCSRSHQLLRFISGEAGTGKSFLIRALQQYLLHKTGSHMACVIAAPTGLAAFNVNGVTLHRLLLLPVEHDNRMEYNKLSPEGAQEIGRLLRKVQLIIIDEVSMVSNLMLAYIHLRLQEILRTPSNILFGGKHLVVFGDLLQLTPVKGQPVFKMLSSHDAVKGIGSIGFVNLWLHFHYHELTENMRQAEDLEYGKMLQGIRVGILSEPVQKILQSRVISNMLGYPCSGPQMMQKLRMANRPSVALMATIADCDKFNQVMRESEQQPLVHMQSKDCIVGDTLPLQFNQKVETRLKHLETSVSHTAGLENTLILCKQCRVMLRRNINVQQGLVNGAMGTVLGFVSDENTGFVTNILVQFDHCEEPNLIGRIHAQFKVFKDIYIKRLQFPLCLAYAITIHKSQGLSLDTALIDIGEKVFTDAMAYVALSRVKRLDGLYIITLDNSKITADRDCVVEYNRLRCLYESHLGLYILPPQKTKKKQWYQTSNVVSETVEPVKKLRKTKHVTFTDVISPAYADQPDNISGFSNTSGVECYCNSSLQLLFEMANVIQDLLNVPTALLSANIGELFHQREQRAPAVLDANAVRNIVADQSNFLHFKLLEQQDCQEFLLALFNVLQHEGVHIDDFISISYEWTHVCIHCENVRSEPFHAERFLFIPIPDISIVHCHNLTINADHGNECSQCGHTMQSTLSSISAQNYVLLVLTRYRANGVKLNTKIEGFKYGQVSLARQIFTTSAIIFHDGETTAGGHYTVWLRRIGSWIKCNDEQITKHARLPFLLKNAYILLLKKP